MPSDIRPARYHHAAFVALALAAYATPALADRVMPLDGTVLIRVIGRVRVLRGEDERVWRERLVDLHEVEVAIGSGFIVSPEGWVVTNQHVVSGDKSTVLVRGEKLEVSVQVTAIEVLMPSNSSTQQPPRRFAASVYAEDPQLDIALLRVNASALPYLALGDSDAAVSGDDVTAVGFPYGDLLRDRQAEGRHRRAGADHDDRQCVGDAHRCGRQPSLPAGERDAQSR